MFRRSAWVFAVFGLLCGTGLGADEAKVIATGDWSKPVTDAQGSSLRGRLLICEQPSKDKLRETPLYVELQNVTEARGSSIRLFCDFGKHDFRPEYKGGLHCELRDKDQRLIEPTSFPFGGGVPKSDWVTLPSDATIRLRATPFGIRRENALAICPHLGALWVIADDDEKEFFLSGNFTVDPAKEPGEPTKDHVWRGTLVLPRVKIVNARGLKAIVDKPNDTGKTRENGPSLSLVKAIALAEKFAERNRIDLSKHHLSSVRAVYKPAAAGKFIWEITWDTTQHVSDDEIVLIVEMNENITRRYGG